RLIPDCLRAIEARVPIQVRSPDAVRPWQHVMDPLAGYLVLAERLFAQGAAFAESWNFGPADDDARPVRWVGEELIGRWGEGPSWRADATARPHEASYLKLDCSKARARLGWRPRWTLAMAMDKVCAWHRSLRDGARMRDVTLAQIDEFEGSGA